MPLSTIVRAAPRLVGSLADALLDLALPSGCASCDVEPGPLCPSCEADLRAGLFERPRPSMPDPVPPHLPLVTAAGPYAGVLRGLVTAYKDDDRRDLRAVLAALLVGPLLAACDGRAALVVPVPSSGTAVRRRGDEPVTDLARAAVRLAVRDGLGGRLPVASCLRPVRRVLDQSRLGQRDRAVNLDGAYAVRSRWAPRLAQQPVVLVDDVITTGATLAEAARAVRVAGGLVVGAATLAATQRRARNGPAAAPSSSHRR